jgi:hypothetical protein
MKKKSCLVAAFLALGACSTISMLDPRTFDPNRLGNRTVVFGSISLVRQKVPQKLGAILTERNWFSVTLKNINTGEYFILVELPPDNHYYLALEPGAYTIDEWIFSTEGKSLKCHSKDLYFHVPPKSFVYLGDLVISMEAKGDIEYIVRDDFTNASYLFYERFVGFIPKLSKNFIEIRTKEDYYFYTE